MKKELRKTKQWANETYEALDIAWGLLREQYACPNEDEKLEIVRFAPAIAGTNRGISDKAKIKQAYNFIYNRTAEYIRSKG